MSKYIKVKKEVKPFSHIIADDNYSVFHYTDGTKKMFAKTLGKLESLGIRIHKSVIINPDQMKQILNYDTMQVQMQDNSIHTVSRRRVGYFLGEIEKLKAA